MPSFRDSVVGYGLGQESRLEGTLGGSRDRRVERRAIEVVDKRICSIAAAELASGDFDAESIVGGPPVGPSFQNVEGDRG